MLRIVREVLQFGQKDARSRGMRVMLGCMTESSRGVSAEGHIASLADNADFDGHLLLAEDPFSGLLLKQRVVLPEDQPGLGVRARMS